MDTIPTSALLYMLDFFSVFSLANIRRTNKDFANLFLSRNSATVRLASADAVISRYLPPLATY